MKKYLLFFVLAGAALAQSTGADWSEFSAYTASPNLYNAIDAKLNYQLGSSAPAACHAGQGFWFNLAGGTASWCSSTNVFTQLENWDGNPSVNGYVLSSTTAGVRSWVALPTGGSMTWPSAAGIAVYAGGNAWGTSLTAPSSALVGLTDTQSLTNKTLDGVSPTTMGYVDATSSIQTQLNSKISGNQTITVSGDCGGSGTTSISLTCTKINGGAPPTSVSYAGYNSAGQPVHTVNQRAIGWSFDGGGSALTTSLVGYMAVPFACTISGWSATVDTGTITWGVWKVATGTAIPTSTNSIVASAAPAISTGTALHSTTLTGWTTSVSQYDIFGFAITAVSSATRASLVLECDQ